MRYSVSGVRRKHLYFCLSTRLAFEDSSLLFFAPTIFRGGFLSPFREERVPSRRRLVAERSESLLICGDGDCPTPHCAKQSLPDRGEKREAPPRHVSGFTPDFVQCLLVTRDQNATSIAKKNSKNRRVHNNDQRLLELYQLQLQATKDCSSCEYQLLN